MSPRIPQQNPRRGQPSDEAADTNELALASLFLGIVWLFGLGSIAGIFLALKSMRQIRESEGREGGRTLAIAGLITGLAGLGSLGLLIVFVVHSSGDQGAAG